MKIFMGNYATAGDFHCLREDNYDSIEDQADNFPIFFSTTGSPDWVKKVQNEIAPDCAPYAADEAEVKEFVASILWEEVSPNIYYAKQKDDVEIYAVLVIREVEINE